MRDAVFHNLQYDNLGFSDVIDLIKNFLEEDNESQYKLTIGTDSEVRRSETLESYLELITAIVIYRKGYGGRYFWRKTRINNSKTLREKIYQEVFQSLETAKVLVPELKLRLNGTNASYDLEIHVDIGERGDTREMIREIVGVVKGFGFVAKTKPESYAASNIADRHT